jgi:membrane-associated phospholipid phosphatase
MIFQTIGVLGPYLLIVASCVYLWMHHKFTYLKYFGAGSALNLLINSLVKMLLKEPRPKEDLLNSSETSPYEFGLSDTGKRQGLDRYGMPSGHAQTTAFTLAFMAPILEAVPNSFVSVFSSLFALYVAVATITVVQRVAFKHHTIAQIMVGLVLGGGLGVLTWRMAKRRTKKVIAAKDDDWKMLH